MPTKRRSKKQHSGLRRHAAVIFLGAFMAVLWGVVAYKALHGKPAQSVPVYYKSAEDAMPLPATMDPEKFENAPVRQAYQVARDIPAVLAQQPCYCYCQRQGHRGLLDCFRTEHAANCNICIKEALLAGRMHREGKSAEEIRAAIIHRAWENVAASSEPTNRQNSKQQ